MGDYRAKLRAMLHTVDRLLKDFEEQTGSYDGTSDWHDRRQMQENVVANKLEREHGARVRDRWDGARVTLCGISSSSTSGVVNALRNWKTAARKKLDAA